MSTTILLGPGNLRGVDREALVGVSVALLEGPAPMLAADGDNFAAGEKLILVCRLRSPALLAMMMFR